MLKQENILMAIRGQGMQNDAEGEEGEGASSATAQRIVYVLHPNCAVEEY